MRARGTINFGNWRDTLDRKGTIQSILFKISVFVSALWQELVFRVCLLPHPTEGVQPITAVIWSVISLGLFLAYRGFRLRHRQYKHRRPYYLSLSLILGVLATGMYLTTGSLWTIAGLHWGGMILTCSRKKGAY